MPRSTLPEPAASIMMSRVILLAAGGGEHRLAEHASDYILCLHVDAQVVVCQRLHRCPPVFYLGVRRTTTPGPRTSIPRRDRGYFKKPS